MFYDIASMFFSVLGIVFLLFVAVFKVMLWREEKFILLVPLKKANKDIYTKIFNIKDFLDFCSLTKKSTVVVLNYGAPDWFCFQLNEYFKNEIDIKILKPHEITELQT